MNTNGALFYAEYINNEWEKQYVGTAYNWFRGTCSLKIINNNPVIAYVKSDGSIMCATGIKNE